MRRPSPVLSYPSANMNAPKISHTVPLEKPDNAQVSAALAGLKPGLASSAGAKSTQGASTVTSVTPMRPMAPPGSGSSIKPTMTPANRAKKYQACGAKPAGAGSRAKTIATAIGARGFQGSFIESALSFLGRSRPCGAVRETPDERQHSSRPPSLALFVEDYPRAGAGPS